MDFLRRFKAIFDFDKDMISLCDNEIRHQIHYLAEEEELKPNFPKQGVVTIDKPVKLKARSEVLVEVKVETKNKQYVGTSIKL